MSGLVEPRLRAALIPHIGLGLTNAIYLGAACGLAWGLIWGVIFAWARRLRLVFVAPPVCAIAGVFLYMTYQWTLDPETATQLIPEIVHEVFMAQLAEFIVFVLVFLGVAIPPRLFRNS